jgi:hypothetical protein
MIEIDATRPIASPLLDMPQEGRDRVARAVDHVVDRVCYEGSAGGRCVYYTMAGCAILMYLGYRVVTQFGSLRLRPDPSDATLWYAIDAESPGALGRGEYHGWIASPEGVFIDFSARDWPDMVESISMDRLSAADAASHAPTGAFAGETTDDVLRWDRPRPRYLWCGADELPDHVRFRPSTQATIALSGRFREAHGESFLRLAIETYKGLLAWPACRRDSWGPVRLAVGGFLGGGPSRLPGRHVAPNSLREFSLAFRWRGAGDQPAHLAVFLTCLSVEGD